MSRCALVYSGATYLPAQGLELYIMVVFRPEDVLCPLGYSDCFGVGFERVAFRVTCRHWYHADQEIGRAES